MSQQHDLSPDAVAAAVADLGAANREAQTLRTALAALQVGDCGVIGAPAGRALTVWLSLLAAAIEATARSGEGNTAQVAMSARTWAGADIAAAGAVLRSVRANGGEP